MSQSSTLYRLQQIDTQLDQSRQRYEAIAKTLQDDLAIQQAHAQFQQAEAALHAAQKTLRQVEDLVQAQNVKIELTEANLYGGKVRNPKELQDLQNESAALKRHREVLEDRQLEAMMSLEEAEAQFTGAQNALNETTARITEQHAGLKGEQTERQRDIERLEIERRAVLGSISPADLDHYERLRQQRRGFAVAKINNRACSACGSTLNTSITQSAASASQLAYCPTCGRILYAG
ncbi:MAG: zinc ribbon domain-containing protein [Chloroflexota bacterium]